MHRYGSRLSSKKIQQLLKIRTVHKQEQSFEGQSTSRRFWTQGPASGVERQRVESQAYLCHLVLTLWTLLATSAAFFMGKAKARATTGCKINTDINSKQSVGRIAPSPSFQQVGDAAFLSPQADWLNFCFLVIIHIDNLRPAVVFFWGTRTSGAVIAH